MENVTVKIQGDKLVIGNSPCLVLNLKNQEHYIETAGKRIPYHAQIALSPDLLSGKRGNVLQTAVNYYYGQACKIAEGVEMAAAYRKHANMVTREKVQTDL